MKKFLSILLLFVGLTGFSQEEKEEKEKKEKVKTFINFNGKKSFLLNDTRYYNFDFGLKVKCKYKLGFGYSWLRGNYKTDLYPVDATEYPNAQATTRTDIKFYSILFEPILVKEKKVNVSIPIHLGISDLTSEYKAGSLNYVNYHSSNPMFADLALDVDFRFWGFMKLGVSVGYRYVASDLEVASTTFSTPLLGFGIKFGKMCK